MEIFQVLNLKNLKLKKKPTKYDGKKIIKYFDHTRYI